MYNVLTIRIVRNKLKYMTRIALNCDILRVQEDVFLLKWTSPFRDVYDSSQCWSSVYPTVMKGTNHVLIGKIGL